MRKATGPGLTALLILAGTSASASPLPQFDTAAYCAALYAADPDEAEARTAGCVALEEDLKAKAGRVWGDLPEEQQMVCKAQASAVNGGSYIYLNGCISGYVANEYMEGRMVLTRPK